MKRRKLQMTMIAVMFAMLMGGCAEEAYTLTEKEEALIVNYSAHVVTKYNTYQKEGLTYVWPEDTEAVEDEQSEAVTSDVQQTEQITGEDGVQAEVPNYVENNTETTYAPNTATLTELFGGSGVELDFVGVRLATTYVDDAYLLYPDEGKQYFVMGIDITNTGQTDTSVDYLTDDFEFQLILNDEVKASSEITLLMQDFSTFEAILKAGETRETILLFQIPTSVTTIERVDLVVSGEESYQIILEND